MSMYIASCLLYGLIGLVLLMVYVLYEIYHGNPYIVGEWRLFLLIPIWPIVLVEIIVLALYRFICRFRYSRSKSKSSSFNSISVSDFNSMYPSTIMKDEINEFK